MEIAINRRGAEMTLRNLMRLLAGLLAALGIAACSSAPAPLSIVVEHPETKHTLTCAAKDKLGRTDQSVLAGVVENCARTLEARGYVRQR